MIVLPVTPSTSFVAVCASDGVRTPVIAAPAGTLCDCTAPAIWVEVSGTARVPMMTGCCKACLDEYDWSVYAV